LVVFLLAIALRPSIAASTLNFTISILPPPSTNFLLRTYRAGPNKVGRNQTNPKGIQKIISQYVNSLRIKAQVQQLSFLKAAEFAAGNVEQHHPKIEHFDSTHL